MNVKTSISEVVGNAWYDLSVAQRVVVTVLVLALGGVMLSGWISSVSSYIEVRRAEKKADAALKKAADIAGAVLKKEKELAKTEEKIYEKQKELDAAATHTARARAEYDRVRVSPRTDEPSPEQLCAELAELGYPCYR